MATARIIMVICDLFPNVRIQFIISLCNSVVFLFVNICLHGHKVYKLRHSKSNNFLVNIPEYIHSLLFTECPVRSIVLRALLLQL